MFIVRKEELDLHFIINYMKEFELKNDILEKHEGVFVFRLKNDNRNINSIKFKTKKKLLQRQLLKLQDSETSLIILMILIILLLE